MRLLKMLWLVVAHYYGWHEIGAMSDCPSCDSAQWRTRP
jgi:hypothetical protein